MTKACTGPAPIPYQIGGPVPGGGSGAGAPVLAGPDINLAFPSGYPRKGTCGASTIGGKRVLGGGPLVGKNGGGGMLRSATAELLSGSTAWLVKAVPNSLPTGSNGSGSPTDPVLVTTSACASRVFCEILLSRLARLVYDRALDWIVRNPVPMHYRQVSRPHKRATKGSATHQSFDYLPLHPYTICQPRPDIFPHRHVLAGHHLQPPPAIVMYSSPLDQPFVPLSARVRRLRREMRSLEVGPVLPARARLDQRLIIVGRPCAVVVYRIGVFG